MKIIESTNEPHPDDQMIVLLSIDEFHALKSLMNIKEGHSFYSQNYELGQEINISPYLEAIIEYSRTGQCIIQLEKSVQLLKKELGLTDDAV